MDTFIELNNEKYLVKRIFKDVTEQDISHFKSLDELNEVLQSNGRYYFCVKLKDVIFEDIIEEQIKEEIKNEEILQQTCQGQDTKNNE